MIELAAFALVGLVVGVFFSLLYRANREHGVRHSYVQIPGCVAVELETSSGKKYLRRPILGTALATWYEHPSGCPIGTLKLLWLEKEFSRLEQEQKVFRQHTEWRAKGKVVEAKDQ